MGEKSVSYELVEERNFWGYDGTAACGKGTYLKAVGEIFDIPVISLGNALRAMSLHFDRVLDISYENINTDSISRVNNIDYKGTSIIIDNSKYEIDDIERDDVGILTSKYCKSDIFKVDLVFNSLIEFLVNNDAVIEGRNCYHRNGPILKAQKILEKKGVNVNTSLNYITVEDSVAADRRKLQDLEKGIVYAKRYYLHEIRKRNERDFNQSTPLLTPEQAKESGFYNNFIDTTIGSRGFNLIKFVEIMKKTGKVPNMEKLEKILVNWDENYDDLLSDATSMAA